MRQTGCADATHGPTRTNQLVHKKVSPRYNPYSHILPTLLEKVLHTLAGVSCGAKLKFPDKCQQLVADLLSFEVARRPRNWKLIHENLSRIL